MNLLKSKTILFGAATAILGLLEGLNVTDLAAFIPDTYEPLVVSAIGTIVILLRLVTTKPVADK